MMRRMAVLTSGGDAPGMNAAVRAVVRAALDRGVEIYAISEGYQGMIDGGDRIRRLDWTSVGGILHRGGTIIGTARCQAFRTREGRRKAVRNLVELSINGLIVIGGDGSLTGAGVLQSEWTSLVKELVDRGEIAPETAATYSYLAVAGLVGSIDNDMYGTDMTIGADTALQRITDAVDAITSTAASHQRAFVVEVMGRRCGYLAVMGAIATAAEWVLIPESPPDVEDWESRMCEVLQQGLQHGRRDNIVIVAEGVQDRFGKPITSNYIRDVLERHLGEDARITVLGHVQRGGSPSAYDRILSTVMGVEAVNAVLDAEPDTEAILIAIRNNKITRVPLMACVEKTKQINMAIESGDFETAMEMRGPRFIEVFHLLRSLVRAFPHPPKPDQKRIRYGVLNAGAPAPGMNAAIRATVRLGLDRGHIPIGITRGFRGLVNDTMEPMSWGSVSGWARMGGSELGTSRKVPIGSEFYEIARNLEEHEVEALVIIGGWAGYEAAHSLWRERHNFPAFNIPIVCVPATIDNNLAGADYSIGSDTALNSITDVVDKIKQSAVASNRCFVVEVMGDHCGYLALMSALATGAERVYLHEEGIRLADLERDIEQLMRGFRQGKRLGLMIRNERANQFYSTQFLAALFEEEGGDLFDVRVSVLGHLQQGGNPMPFDRILAVRMAARSIEIIENGIHSSSGEPPAVGIGLLNGEIQITPLEQVMRMSDTIYQRPKQQWWMSLRPIASMLAKPEP